MYGVRVPVAVVSPYAKAHYVSHVVDDHTSILAFIEYRFGLPSLTNRDGNANPMLDMFDFSSPSFATPPTLPTATVDPTQLIACGGTPAAQSVTATAAPAPGTPSVAAALAGLADR
jgi:phospholipase C